MRQCANCRWWTTTPAGWHPWDIDNRHRYGQCTLAHNPPDSHNNEGRPMWADGNDGYESWLWVLPDHLCNAWQPAPETENRDQPT